MKPVPSEPEFVGADRAGLVDGMTGVFDRVEATGEPQWIRLVAPSGWGKSRLVREFYARLAAGRQDNPAYWPARIDDGSGDVHQRRKRVAPTVVDRPGGSLPAWFWWGVTCSTRNGVASAALVEDAAQLEAHRPWIDLKRRSLRSGIDRRTIAELASLIGGEAGSEARDAAVAAAVGQAIPGSGLVWELAKWFGRETRAARQRRRGNYMPGAKAYVYADFQVEPDAETGAREIWGIVRTENGAKEAGAVVTVIR